MKQRKKRSRNSTKTAFRHVGYRYTKHFIMVEGINIKVLGISTVKWHPHFQHINTERTQSESLHFDKVSDTLIFPYFFSSRKIVWLIIYTIFPIPTFSNEKLQITENYSFHFSKEHFKLLHSSLFLIIFQSPTTDYPHITNVSQLSQKPEIVHSSCTPYSQFPHSQISNFK